jgi:hypothetical protein
VARKLRSFPRFFFLGVFIFIVLIPSCAKKNPLPAGLTFPPDRLASLQPLFADPPAEYRSAPLWVWNDRVTKAEIDDQLSDFKAKGIGGVFVHPRPGLITPYLSPEWLDLFKYAVDTGRKLGMKIWIYDENSYPSGFGGGHVPAAIPDAVRSGLRLTKRTELPKAFPVKPVVVLQKTDHGFVNITPGLKGENFGPGEYYVFDLNKQSPSPWYGGFTYVDIMRPDVTAKFLEVTLDPYKKAFGADFGSVVPGSFQDEAEISPAGGQGLVVVNWTPRLFAAFQSKWGYDLAVNLPSLFEERGDWMRVRHDYYALLLDLFVEGWAKPYSEYCLRNNLVFTGHYWEHEWPRPAVDPDNMALESWSHMPGIDILMNDFQTDTHAQFGNARSVKEIRSAANQTGLPRTMSETYGAGGWDLTFFDQKRIADWQFALGVNFVNQHLSYVTIMGARKRDHPQSFSYHEPWWNDYKVMGDYLGRLSLSMTAGRQDNRILVLEPTTTAWMYFAPGGDSNKIKSIGKRFQDFVNDLEAAQLEYDLGSESILRGRGVVDGASLRVGPQKYDAVVLPPALENIDSSTYDLLAKFVRNGGNVLAWGGAPLFLDGRPDPRPAELAAAHPQNWITLDIENWESIFRRYSPPAVDFRIQGGPANESPHLLFHHRRSLRDGELVFLANVDPLVDVSGEFTGPGQSCQRWDAMSGTVDAYPAEIADGKLRVKFHLPPGGSLLLALRPEASSSAAAVPASASIPQDIPAAGPTRIVRAAENVLTLDYCDLTVGGVTEKNLFFYEAQLKTFRAHGLDRNPWDSAVQYKTNILDKDSFAKDSGFEATFHFRVAGALPQTPLSLVVERPKLFEVFVNGRKVEPREGSWWMDKAFGVYPLANVGLGENAITLKAKPFTIHSELEAVYLLGDFGLESAAQGFVIVPPKPLAFAPWSGQGLPMYSGAVNYTKIIDLPASPPSGRILVELGSWLGAEAEVFVNGGKIGLIAFAPFNLDITAALKPGKNEVTVAVIGTLKNTLGPFHNKPLLGRAWPSGFQQGAKGGRPAGKDYSVVGYGLFEDFKIRKN